MSDRVSEPEARVMAADSRRLAADPHGGSEALEGLVEGERDGGCGLDATGLDGERVAVGVHEQEVERGGVRGPGDEVARVLGNSDGRPRRVPNGDLV